MAVRKASSDKSHHTLSDFTYGTLAGVKKVKINKELNVLQNCTQFFTCVFPKSRFSTPLVTLLYFFKCLATNLADF